VSAVPLVQDPYLGQSSAALVVVVEQVADGVDDLLPPAVADCQGDMRRGCARRGGLDGLLEYAGGRIGQQIQ
jgi:hypothetical protein